MKRLILIYLLVAVQSAFGAFGYYRPITIDHTKVPSTQTDFPVLVSFTNAALKTTGNGGHVTSSSGFDIRPYSDVGITTPITKFELERYNATTGEVVMWVTIASLSSSVDTVIYLAYGDSGVTTDGSSNTTWDSNYMCVYHLKDGTTLSLSDSTSHADTLTNTASVAATSGQVDGAAGSFNGTSQALNTSVAVTPLTNKLTLSMWANIPSFNNNDKLLAEYSTNFNSNDAFMVDPNSSASSQFDVVVKRGVNLNGGHFTRPSTGAHHFFFTFDYTQGTAIAVTAKVDNVAQTITQDNAANVSGGNFGSYVLYLSSRAATSLFMSNTYIDEVRFSTGLRSADWNTTDYNTQSSPSTFFTLGAQVPPDPTGNAGAFFLFFGSIEKLFTWHPFLNDSR